MKLYNTPPCPKCGNAECSELDACCAAFFKIQNNIPIPDNNENEIIFDTINNLKVGDSFAFPWKKESKVRNTFKKHSIVGRKFTIRLEDDHYRCWRVK